MKDKTIYLWKSLDNKKFHENNVNCNQIRRTNIIIIVNQTKPNIM